MKLYRFICATLLITTLSFTGCAGKANYNAYHKEVNNLYEKIVSTDAIINNIDTTSETSVDEMFESLDSLKESFDEFAKVDTPEEFKDCQFLADNAVKYIEIAETNFHTALDGEYDDVSFKEGMSSYNEAIKCVNYMGDVLQRK